MHKKYGFVIDSGLTNLENQYELDHLYIIPLYININNKTYKDLKDINIKDIYKYLDNGFHITTSQATIIDYENKLKYLKEKKYTDIFIFCMSGKLSGTINSAYNASKNIDGLNIYIIDTKIISSIGIKLVKDIINYSKKNKLKPEEVIKYSNNLFSKVRILFFVDSLDYLEKGGRIKKQKATIAKILNIKPILKLNDGKLEQIAIDRTLKRTILKMCNMVKKEKFSRLIAVYPDDNILKSTFFSILEKEFLDFKYETLKLNAPIISHTGPYIGAIIYILK